MRGLGLAASFVVLIAGCGDDATTGDTGPAPPDAADTLPPLESVTPPAPPVLTDCPSGWVETATARGAVWCEPYPGGAQDCVGAEAHFPGGAGCEVVGTACPAADFPEDLPTDARVIYVLPGATGGVGTPTSPFGTITQATRDARTGDIVAIAKGTYDENVALPPGVTLWGACVAETMLTSSVATTGQGVVTPMGTGTHVRNLRIAGAQRPAIFVDARREITLTDVVIDDVVFAGIVVYGAGNVIARTLVVRDTKSLPLNGQGGASLVLLDGAAADVSHAVFERSRDLGVVVDGIGSSLVMEDCAVRVVLPRDDTRAGGRGIEAANEAEVALNRVAVVGVREMGVLSWYGGSLAATDLMVRDTESRANDGAMGVGLAVGQATGRCSRCAFIHNQGLGVIAQSGDLSMEDVVISDTQPLESGDYGRGLEAQLAGRVELRRIAIDENRDVAIFAGGADLSLLLEDVSVRGTLPGAMGLRGRGLETIVGVTVEVHRAVFEDNHEVSVMASLGSSLRLVDVRVTDTVDRACAADGCPSVGTGIGAYSGAAVDVSRFRVERAFLCGVHVAEDGQLDLAEGVVTMSEFGACVQADGYVLDRLQQDVDYVDNEHNLESTSLPVPEPSSAGTVDRS